MLHRSFLYHSFLLLVVLTTACTAPAIQQPTVPPGSEAATQAASEQASRIVALTSLSADIIHQLDKTKLVGIAGSRLLAQNPDLAKLPKVSEGRTQVRLETVVALKPDLVIGAKGIHDQVLTQLQATGIRTLTTEVNTWRSLDDLTRTLANTVGADPAPLLQSYQALLPAQPAQPVSTLVLASQKPILAPNKTSWAGDLLAQFGAKNVVADLQGKSPFGGYITLSPEAVLKANPEVLILVNTGDGTIDQLKSAPFWNQLQAVKTDRVYVFDYFGLVNPGSIGAIKQACDQLQQVFAMSGQKK